MALLLAAPALGDQDAQLEGGAEAQKLTVPEAQLLLRALWLCQALAQALLVALLLGLCPQPEAELESVGLWLLLGLRLGLPELQALPLRVAAEELELL